MDCIYIISVRTNPNEEKPKFAYWSVFAGTFDPTLGYATRFESVGAAEQYFKKNRNLITSLIREHGYDRRTLAIKKIMFRTMKDL